MWIDGNLCRRLCFVPVLLAIVVDVAYGSIKCFCDKRNCEDSLICTGNWCLIGFKNDGGSSTRLEQLCGTGDEETAAQLEQCELGWNGWQEVCACREDFCNTFAFLRGSIEQFQTNAISPPRHRQYPGGDLSNTASGGFPIVHTDDVDGSYRPRYQSNSLIILLVIIPLSVGGMAVCLIFVNYHCKMC